MLVKVETRITCSCEAALPPHPSQRVLECVSQENYTALAEDIDRSFREVGFSWHIYLRFLGLAACIIGMAIAIVMQFIAGFMTALAGSIVFALGAIWRTNSPRTAEIMNRVLMQHYHRLKEAGTLVDPAMGGTVLVFRKIDPQYPAHQDAALPPLHSAPVASAASAEASAAAAAMMMMMMVPNQMEGQIKGVPGSDNVAVYARGELPFQAILPPATPMILEHVSIANYNDLAADIHRAIWNAGVTLPVYLMSGGIVLFLTGAALLVCSSFSMVVSTLILLSIGASLVIIGTIRKACSLNKLPNVVNSVIVQHYPKLKQAGTLVGSYWGGEIGYAVFFRKIDPVPDVPNVPMMFAAAPPPHIAEQQSMHLIPLLSPRAEGAV